MMAETVSASYSLHARVHVYNWLAFAAPGFSQVNRLPHFANERFQSASGCRSPGYVVIFTREAVFISRSLEFTIGFLVHSKIQHK